MNILLVDDSQATALPIIAFLQQQGHSVRYFQDGLAALDAFQADMPDLVLMDVEMPKMNGVEATRRIKALGGARWVPVLLMTALSAKEDIVAGLDAGADDYIIKPVVTEVLNARMRSIQRIANMQASMAGILDNVYEAILTINELGTVQSYNRAAERIFGYLAAEVIGANVKMLMPSPYTDEHDAYLSRYVRARTPRVIGIGRKVQGRRKNGEVFPMRLAVTEVAGIFGSQFIGLVSDISAEEAARKHIEFLALHDPLTALPNRAYFNEMLDKALKSMGGGMHALLFIDLDGFKPINDRYGHDAGDAALMTIAKRLRHGVKERDFVARLGGDEFVVLLADAADGAAAVAIGERLLEDIGKPMELLGHHCTLGASIGAALIPQHGSAADQILSAADRCMYEAKRAGKNCVILAPAKA